MNIPALPLTGHLVTQMPQPMFFHHSQLPAHRSSQLGPEDDRLLWRGAVLLADETFLVFIPGDAAVLVEAGQAQAGLLFDCQGQLVNGVGRTDLAAEVAVVLAVPVARIAHGRPDTLPAGLQTCRLQIAAVGLAHADALAAANAAVEKLRLRDGARRPDEMALIFIVTEGRFHNSHGHDTRRHGPKQSPARQIDPVDHIVPGCGEIGHPGRTDDHTVETLDALR